ncbi:hypothetical protein JB92DRAFT_2881792 [Gautieria morchelliformis]|nr:hypothetical protein JB92DRAFT_2881792 [Gautieria morchelliformis]
MPPDSLFITISVLLKSVGLATVLAFGSITRAGSTIVFCFLFIFMLVSSFYHLSHDLGMLSLTENIGQIIRILQCGTWL